MKLLCLFTIHACPEEHGLLQDKMLTRVETARKEMQHIGDFDYGKLKDVEAVVSILVLISSPAKIAIDSIPVSNSAMHRQEKGSMLAWNGLNYESNMSTC